MPRTWTRQLYAIMRGLREPVAPRAATLFNERTVEEGILKLQEKTRDLADLSPSPPATAALG